MNGAEDNTRPKHFPARNNGIAFICIPAWIHAALKAIYERCITTKIRDVASVYHLVTLKKKSLINDNK